VGQYELTSGGEFLVRYEYCDGSPALHGRNQWFPLDDDTVVIGPIAPADALDFPILHLSHGIARPGDDPDEVVVDLHSSDGPGGRLRLRSGRRCIESRCGADNVYACD
jgi:hypothetical protein